MITFIALNKILPNPYQTRIGEPDPEYIKALALDIAAHGLLQTPIGRLAFDQVELAFGHNRLAAFRWLNDLRDNSDIQGDYSQMPVQVQELSDVQMAELAWSENEQRRDVTPIERAKAIERRMEAFGWSLQECADHLGLARPTISNILRLLKLPEHIQDAIGRGDISARVASALLPMYELPQHIIDLANANYWNSLIDLANNSYWNKPSDVVREALGGASSDEIREGVSGIFKAWTKPLADAPWKLDELFPEGEAIYCGLCRTCDRRMKDNGNLCIDMTCYKAKEGIAHERYLLKAAQACGFEPVDPEKGGQVSEITSWSSSGGNAEKIIASKCANLRLMWQENPRREAGPVNVPGHPHARIVCDKRNNSCTCIKGLSLARSAPAPVIVEQDVDLDLSEDDIAAGEEYARQQAAVRAQTPAELEDLARQARKAKRDVAGAFAELQERLHKLAVEWVRYDEPGALWVLLNHTAHVWNEKELEFDNLYAEAARQIVRALIGEAGSYESTEWMYEVVNRRLNKLLLPGISQVKTLVEVFAEEEARDGL